MYSTSDAINLKTNEPQFVYLLEDDMVVARQISHILSCQGYHVRSYNSPDMFLKRKAPTHVSCLISDMKLPGMSGLDVQKVITRAGWILPMIFITGFGTVPIATEAMKDGAVDFLEKPVKEKPLMKAVEKALQNSATMFENHSKQNEAKRRVRQLSERELVVMQRMLSGWLNKQIAAELDISERTVKSHRASIIEKMGVESIPQLVPIAMLAGVTAAEDWSSVAAQA